MGIEPLPIRMVAPLANHYTDMSYRTIHININTSLQTCYFCSIQSLRFYLSYHVRICPNHPYAICAVVDINNRGLGSTVSATQPTGVENGYVWLDADSGVAASVKYSESYYDSLPPQNPTTGSLWIDSASSPLTMHVWSGTTWRAIGA